MQIKANIVLSAVLAVVCASSARAQEEPKSFQCNFTSGTTWTFEKGAFKSEQPKPIAFTIADIDLEGQKADLVLDKAAPPTPLKVVRAINANHFLEVVNEGFLNLTTVYDKDATSGTYPAVHSRHFGVLGQPVVAQYVGSCTDN